MRADKITVFELFEKQRRYLVPIFQRGYVWKMEDQWKPLWEDLIEQVKVVQTGSGTNQNQQRRHFLGAIVLGQMPTMIKQIQASEIIDGQQRLMTLQVILAAFRDVVTDSDNEYVIKSLDTLTANSGALSNIDEKHKVWPTNAYQDDFRNIMLLKSRDEVIKNYPYSIRRSKIQPSLPPLIEAYLYYYGVIKQFLYDGQAAEFPNIISAIDAGKIDLKKHGEKWPQDVSERADELCEAIARQVQLVEIELGDEDDPQVIFETLNARGVPLEPSDLIRNFVFLYAARNSEDTGDLYERYWKEFDITVSQSGKFWKETIKQGRFKRSRLDLLFFHYIIFRTGQDIKMSHVYEGFRSYWEENGTRRISSDELEAIRRSSNVFKLLTDPSANNRLGLFAQRLRSLDTTTVYPLVLWLHENRRGLNDEEFNGILEDIESYLIRRAVCNLTMKNYNRTFLGLLNKLRKEGSVSRALLRQELAQLTGDSDVWPDFTLFSQHLLNSPLYNILKPSKTQMLLKAIEIELFNPKSEGILIPDNLTIEHVMPQGYKPEEWPYLQKDVDTNTLQVGRWNAINTLGNLTLLTQQLNSTVSNGPFSKKRSEIAKQSQLKLNSYFQQFTDDFQWDEKAIAIRSLHLAAVALKIWPGPDKSMS
jgi:uncharacterized protein with ParB-like and HNH nuclease domain